MTNRQRISAFLSHFRARRGVTLAAVALLACPTASAQADPIVVVSASAAAMVASLIGANPGIQVVVGSETFTGFTGTAEAGFTDAAAGTFSGGSGILPFNDGVVLTTGSIALVPGPNNDPFAGVDNGVAGDARFTAVAGAATFDASILSFDFIPTGDSISFQYAFGSDEYNEFVGAQFNDPFLFLLNGVNVALIPGTSTPVTINSVNAGQNSAFFSDNNGATLNIQYDGLVGVGTALFATGAVNPGVVNTIVLGTADAGDGLIDSGVILAAGTFVTNVRDPDPDPGPMPEPIPEPGTMLLVGSGVAALAHRARRRKRNESGPAR